MYTCYNNNAVNDVPNRARQKKTTDCETATVQYFKLSKAKN